MIAENGQRLRCNRPRRDMKDSRRQFAGYLEHVRDHQKQALRRGERSRQRACLQRAVNGARSPALALHFLNDRAIAPDILDPRHGPLISQFGHRRGRCDGIDRANFIHPVGDMGNRRVTIHRGLCSLSLSHGTQPPRSYQWRGRGIVRNRPRSRCICHSRKHTACPAPA